MRADPTGLTSFESLAKQLPPPPPPPPEAKVQGVIPPATPSVEKTKSWVGTEIKTTKVEEKGNVKTTTTNVTGDSASGASITLRGTAGHETTTTTETGHGLLTTQITETHKEGLLQGAGGFSKNGLEAGGTVTAVEHGYTWTATISVGPISINLPGVGLSFGIGAGAKANVGVGDSGRVEATAKASVGESLSLKYLPPSISLK